MEQFKARFPEQAKNLQSWEVLLQAVRSHRSYRMALRNSKGPCIPAQCVGFFFSLPSFSCLNVAIQGSSYVRPHSHPRGKSRDRRIPP
jgi:hypothetical protein